MKRQEIAAEALVDLRRRLQVIPARSPERRRVMQETATLYGVFRSHVISGAAGADASTDAVPDR